MRCDIRLEAFESFQTPTVHKVSDIIKNLISNFVAFDYVETPSIYKSVFLKTGRVYSILEVLLWGDWIEIESCVKLKSTLETLN